MVGQLEGTLEALPWELEKMLQKAGPSHRCLEMGAEPGWYQMFSQEAFVQQQFSDPSTVACAFSYFQQEVNGLMDF